MGVSKRIFLIALALCLVPLGAMAGALNGDSSVFSKELALRALNWNNAQTADDFRAIFEAEGFEVIAQNNFDKAADDPAHTCAWTAARGTLDTGDGQRDALVIAIRGTTAGEWYSNVDIAPSQQDGGVFAENFLFAAQDVFVNLQPILEQLDADTAIVVTGHSRGGACANLLGMLLNEEIGMERVYVYTSAAPATVKYTWSVNYSNIFNLVNAGDIVPRVPLAAWGYTRLGEDIALTASDEETTDADRIADTLAAIAPDVASYYGTRHSLTEAGLSEDGATAYEVMLSAAASLTGLGADNAEPSADISWDALSEESDFAPLFDLFRKAAEDDWTAGKEIMRRHMPATYMQLLSAYEGEN